MRSLMSSSYPHRQYLRKNTNYTSLENIVPFPLLNRRQRSVTNDGLDYERYDFDLRAKKKPLSSEMLKEYKEFGMMSHTRPAEQMIKRSTIRSSKRKQKSSALFKEYSDF